MTMPPLDANPPRWPYCAVYAEVRELAVADEHDECQLAIHGSVKRNHPKRGTTQKEHFSLWAAAAAGNHERLFQARNVDLAQALQEKGLSTTGRKRALVDRLLKHAMARGSKTYIRGHATEAK